MKPFALMLISLMALGTLGHAEDAKSAQDLGAYLDKLQVKLEHTAQRSNQPTSGSSSVMGLRGSKQEPISKQLYWKGKTGPVVVSPDEVKLFRTAIEEAKAGHNDLAVTTLKSFLEKYPKSGLAGDAADSLKILSTAQALPTEAAPTKS